MEAKKCLRCGIFHLGNEDVCKTCKENDMKDIEKLNSFMDYNGLEKITRYMNTYIKDEVYGGNEIKKNAESEIL